MESAADARLCEPGCGSSAGARRWCLAIGLLVLAAYGAFLARNFSPVYGGSDSSGYMNSARLLTRANFTEPIHLVPELGETPFSYCAPLGYVPQGTSGRMAPTYPVGLPVLLAASTMVAGWHWGPVLLFVVSSLLTIACCYAASRELGVARSWSAVAAASLACSPLLIWSSEQVLSDAQATTWCLVAFYAALRGQRSLVWAGCCGVAFVVAVTIRPTDFFLLPALALVLWNWKNLVSAVVGGLPLAAGYGWYNQFLWGQPWTTGYGSIYSVLNWASAGPTLAFYAHWVPHLLPISALGCLGLVCLPWRSQGRVLASLVLWCAALLGPYAFYPITREVWWCMRFVLPAFPALAILGAMALQRVDRYRDRRGRPLIAGLLAAAVLLISCGLGIRDWNALGVCHLQQQEFAYLHVAEWVREHMPDTAICCTVSASGTLVFEGRVVMRWDQVPPDQWEAIVAAVRQSGRPLYLVEFEHFADKARSKTPGTWRKIATVRSFGIWELARADDRTQTLPGTGADAGQGDVSSTAPVDRNVVRAAHVSTR